MSALNSNKFIAWWLFVCAFMVLAMIVIGGYTRLQGAGLSIVEWKPVAGIFPPITSSEWDKEFVGYKHSPEYQHKNFGITLGEFKRIYFIEYFHRLIGRVTGLIFIVPFIYFVLRKQLSPSSIRYLAVVLALGALQGALGWYMVKSGLHKVPHVSHYRLVMHLMAAIAVYGLLIWKALDYFKSCHPRESGNPDFYAAIEKKGLDPRFRGDDIGGESNSVWYIFTALILFQIALGGFIAGLKGGLIYNTFPLMDGHLVPYGLFVLKPWYLNFTDNITMLQFLHRTLAIGLMIYAACVYCANKYDGIKTPIKILMVLISMQVIVGIATLIMIVPLHLALTHQLLAMFVFTNLLLIIHRLRCRSSINY